MNYRELKETADYLFEKEKVVFSLIKEDAEVKPLSRAA